MTPPNPPALHSRTPLLVALAAILAYAGGLAGPFVLDDHVNLAPIWSWLRNELPLSTALFDNRSGPTGRPLAYLSFALNAQIGGTATLGFKLVNLALHLTAGALVLLLVRRVLDSTPAARETFSMGLAIALAALWLLHPLHVSSVLYVVQRMALLGALAQLGAVLVYLHGRAMLDQDPQRARRWLFLAFPSLVVVGLLGKETAVLAPLLCAVAELTLFAGARRPRLLLMFFGVFLLLPAVVVLARYALDPARILAGYVGREFTLGERLLTQPRVLLEQAVNWFWPAQLGLYRDGFPASRGWLSPGGTTTAIALWSVLALAAVALRRRAPLFAFGVLWFLAGHALEAGPFALEPYFEHRNYLPSLGLLIATAAAAMPLLRRLPTTALQSGAISLCLCLVVLTAIRGHQWGDIDRLLASEGPPAGEVSRRLQVDRAIRALERRDDDAREEALALLDRGPAGHRAAAALWRVVFECDTGQRVSAKSLGAMQARSPAVLTHSHVSWLWLLTRRAAAHRCAGLSPQDALRTIAAWEHGARQPLPGRAQRQLPLMREQLAGTSSASAQCGGRPKPRLPSHHDVSLSHNSVAQLGVGNGRRARRHDRHICHRIARSVPDG